MVSVSCTGPLEPCSVELLLYFYVAPCSLVEFCINLYHITHGHILDMFGISP